MTPATRYRYLVYVIDGERQLNVMYSGAVRVQVWSFGRVILHQYRTVPRSTSLGRSVGCGSWQLPGNEGCDHVRLWVVRHAAGVDGQRRCVSTYGVKRHIAAACVRPSYVLVFATRSNKTPHRNNYSLFPPF